MFSIFKRKPKGIIADLALEDFYSTLTTAEIEEIKDSLAHPYQLSSRPYTRDDLDKGSRTYGRNAAVFLYNMAEGGVSLNLKKRLLIESYNRTTCASDRYFTSMSLVELLYKEGDYEACESYCLKVIDDYPELKLDRVIKDVDIFAFHRLAIMYEKQGRIQDAINISELALEYGQHDGTKNGFTGRITRLRKKLI